MAERLDLPLARRLTRNRVLACAARLVDLGFFRVGGEQYADENGTYRLATMHKEHATVDGETVVFTHLSKGNQERVQAVVDQSRPPGRTRPQTTSRR